MSEPPKLIANTDPPKSKTVNWLRVKSRYINGEPLATIAKEEGVKVNTISVTASRKGWALERAAMTKAQEAKKQPVIEEWLGNMAISVLEGSRYWCAIRLAGLTLKEARDVEAARAQHIDSGRKLFGLDRDLDQQSKLAKLVGNIIDVKPVTALPAPAPAAPQSASPAPDSPPIPDPEQLGSGASE